MKVVAVITLLVVIASVSYQQTAKPSKEASRELLKTVLKEKSMKLLEDFHKDYKHIGAEEFELIGDEIAETFEFKEALSTIVKKDEVESEKTPRDAL
ncbi:uncharacterized protein LOC129004713 isoform X2 [Macrosteles quadrilineatus]|uniref:uncharacterized protein LOC129004713 isoform X2 n=1 Tax=Macrosteles quadrilineatus TaxID=74068 RepID=UPI0023E18014|nr:uncharacterized protein LOC129004713 isoform X2 [Macrosteles quadrilineatus]